ncbi:hypothetical protein [Brevundimonas sp.]|uniref:hypothetical protein n=1 Tax=Brevundimonas sp. TaxID=1871086 RepID=UPI0025C53131|nr:hypothetical protein [Brevundimonas sp.]
MLKLWLRAANPFNAPRAMAEAQRAARVGTFGLLASGAVGAISSLLTWLHPEWLAAIVANQQAKMQMSAEQAAMQSAMIGSIMPVALLASMVFGIALSLVLAWAQWKYMTRAIPIIVLAMFVYSMLIVLIAVATGQYNGRDSGYLILLGVSWAVQIVSAVLYVASLRGAFVLHRLKQEP